MEVGAFMELTNSEYLYLTAIYKLSKKMILVKCTDIAKELNYSMPSVLAFMKRLEDKEFITYGERKSIVLTPKGLDIANALFNKQKMLTEAFMKMGASNELASSEATNISHFISNEMLDIINKYFTLISD